MPEPERMTRRVRLRWTTLLLAGAFAVGSHALAATGPAGLGGLGTPQPPAPSSAAYDGMTIDEVETVVKGAGYNYTRMKNPDGDILQITTKDGLGYQMGLADCPQGGEVRCATLNMWSLDFNEDPKVTLQSINKFNNGAWGVRAMLYNNGKSGIALNLGIDGDITGKWLVSRLGNFDVWVSKYNDFVSGKTETPAPAP